MISSITSLGMLVGGICFGILGDKIGRVKTFSHTVLIFALATGLMAFANNIYEIYALRFLAGIGAGGEYGVGIALIAENFESDRIGKMTSIAAVGGQIVAIFSEDICMKAINSSKLKKMKKVHYYVMSLKKCFQPHVLLFKA